MAEMNCMRAKRLTPVFNHFGRPWARGRRQRQAVQVKIL